MLIVEIRLICSTKKLESYFHSQTKSQCHFLNNNKIYDLHIEESSMWEKKEESVFLQNKMLLKYHSNHN